MGVKVLASAVTLSSAAARRCCGPSSARRTATATPRTAASIIITTTRSSSYLYWSGGCKKYAGGTTAAPPPPSPSSAAAAAAASSSACSPSWSSSSLLLMAGGTARARRRWASSSSSRNRNKSNRNRNRKSKISSNSNTIRSNNTSNNTSNKSGAIILPSVRGLDEWRQLDRSSGSDGGPTGDTLLRLPPAPHLPSAPPDWNGYESSTPIFEEVAAQIAATGRPLSTADFVQLALQHPRHGYYTRAQSRDDDDLDGDDDDLDAEDDFDDATATATATTSSSSSSSNHSIIGGDFVTAPEVSQVFGECLGVWFATQYSAITTAAGNSNNSSSNSDSSKNSSSSSSSSNKNRDWQWLECGPGTGKLMTDLLRFTRDLSRAGQQTSASGGAAANANANPLAGFGRNCRRVHLVETSPALRRRQRAALQRAFRHDFHFEFFGFDDDGDAAIQEDPGSSIAAGTEPTKTTAPSSSSSSATGKSTTSSSADGGTFHKKKRTIAVHWHRSLQDFRLWQQQQNQQQGGDGEQQQPLTFAVAQEFVDALPVYAFEKTADNVWRERLVDVALRADVERDLLLEEEEEAARKKRQQQQQQQQQPQPQSETATMDSSAAKTAAETAASSSASTSSTKTEDPKKPRKKPRLRVVLAPEVTPPLRTLLGADEEGRLRLSPGAEDAAPAGSIVEVCPEGILAAQDLAAIVAAHGGAALLIDYGSAEGSRDSLRGYSRHREEPFLSRPGLIDITADVDFGALRHAVNHRPQPKPQQQPPPPPPIIDNSSAVDNDNNNNNNSAAQQPAAAAAASAWTARAHGPVSQGAFLVSMGIQERIVSMIEKPHVTDDEAEALVRAMERLVSHEPQHMGERYKVLAITARPNDSSSMGGGGDDDIDAPPPGF